jgi:AAA family ATP:ADP antiporter
MLPMIAIGATSGAAYGSWIVDWLVDSGLVATESLLLVATLPLFASILLTRVVDRRESVSDSAPDVDEEEQGLGFLLSGAKLILVSRFVLAAAMVTLLVNWVNTNGENLLFRVLQETLAGRADALGFTDPAAIQEFTRDETTLFYGRFYFWVNIAALFLQSIVASRLLKYGGFAAIILILPVVSLAAYSTMAILPVLAVVMWGKSAENATDYSLNNTARHVLWLPVPSKLTYRGKPAIDTLYVRVGDGMAAVTVLVGVQFLALATETFFLFNVSLVLLWFGFCILMVREHRKASEAVASNVAE